MRDFVRGICEALSLPIPEEAKPLFVRVEMDKHVASYLRGETETTDILLSDVCMALTDGDFALLAQCYWKLREFANVPSKLLAQRAGFRSMRHRKRLIWRQFATTMINLMNWRPGEFERWTTER